MPQLHLPFEHTDADLVLATLIADALDAGELYVAWSAESGPGAAPQVVAVVRERESSPVAGAFAAFFAHLRRALLGPPAPRTRPRARRALG